MVNSSVFKNMAELHEATLQSQSVQSYPNIISKAYMEPTPLTSNT